MSQWKYHWTCKYCGEHGYTLVHTPTRWFSENAFVSCNYCHRADQVIEVVPFVQPKGWDAYDRTTLMDLKDHWRGI